MSSRIKPCKYGCGTMIAWDDTQKVFIEPHADEAVHSRERCQSIRGTGTSESVVVPHKGERAPDVDPETNIHYQILQQLRKANSLLARIAGVEE